MIARWLSAGSRVRVAALAVLVMAGGACDKMPLTAPTESTIQISAAPTVPLNGSVDVVAALRDALQQFQFNAAVKAALAWRGVPVKGDVRAPLLPLDASERAALEARLEELTA